MISLFVMVNSFIPKLKKYELSKFIKITSILFHSKCLFLADGLSPEAPSSASCFQAATPEDSLSVLIQASVASILGFDLHILELRYLYFPVIKNKLLCSRFYSTCNLILVNLVSNNNIMCSVFTCNCFGHEKRLHVDPCKNELNSLSLEDTFPLQGAFLK